MLILLIKYFICILFFLFIITLLFFLKKKTELSNETIRKMAHILFSISWFVFYALFWKTDNFYIAPLIGVGITVVGTRTNLLNLLKRENKKKYDLGIILYALTEFILAAFAFFYPVTLPACTCGMFSISFGDGAAALVGHKWGKYTLKFKNGKSLAGSMACLIFSMLAMTIACWLMGFHLHIWKYAILAIVVTIVEFFGNKYDNLLIGLTVTFVGVVLKV